MKEFLNVVFPDGGKVLWTGTMADWPAKNTDVAATIRLPSAPQPGIISTERFFNSSDPLENVDGGRSQRGEPYRSRGCGNRANACVCPVPRVITEGN
jgi:hypothetical protein